MVIERQIAGAARRVVAPDGTHWLVYELSGVYYDRRRSLVFESETTMRRVRCFPDDWALLSNDELLALSWSA
ncbi:MAG: hypothetical protein HOQ09_06030 [Gemmatimonadaceae bacterium]|nr:hypothetical protein [Gemmatimonadaceae bacterium]